MNTMQITGSLLSLNFSLSPGRAINTVFTSIWFSDLMRDVPTSLLCPRCTKRGANEFVRHDFFVKFKCRDETRGSFPPRLRSPREFSSVRPEYAIQKLLYTVFHNTIHTAEQNVSFCFGAS